MEISLDEFELIEKWSKLSLGQEEKKLLYKELNKILGEISSIEEIKDEQDNEKFVTTLELKDLREDKITSSLNRDLVLKNAPHIEEDMFKVPNILP